ncbi:MAG: hypothetical protein ACRC6B_12725, partial [Fusobacteriaceae bacterium]
MKGIKQIMESINNLSSTNDKITLLQQNKDNELLKEVLFYTYNPDFKYGFTTSQLNKSSDGRVSKWNNLFEMLEELAKSNVNNELRQEVLAFINSDAEVKEVYKRIVAKDFKNGVKIKTVNKVWNNLIPTFDIQRPEANAKLKLKEDERFLLMIKENGSRGTYYNGKMMTRQGKEHKGIEHIVEQVERVFGKDYIVDGELVHVKEAGVGENERLRKTISILNSDESEDKEKIEFIIFDLISNEEYNSENYVSKFI